MITRDHFQMKMKVKNATINLYYYLQGFKRKISPTGVRKWMVKAVLQCIFSIPEGLYVYRMVIKDIYTTPAGVAHRLQSRFSINMRPR